MDGAYSSEVVFDSEKKARKAIIEYKESASDNIKSYFKRKAKRTVKTKILT